VELLCSQRGQLEARVGGAAHQLEVHENDGHTMAISLDGHRRRAAVFNVDEQVWVHLSGTTYTLRWVNPLPITTSRREAAGSLRAPMPGKVIRVAVQEGAQVAAGDLLMILEAMKMEHRIEAPRAGVVHVIRYQQGDTVNADEILLELTDESPQT